MTKPFDAYTDAERSAQRALEADARIRSVHRGRLRLLISVQTALAVAQRSLLSAADDLDELEIPTQRNLPFSAAMENLTLLQRIVTDLLDQVKAEFPLAG